MLGEEMKNKKLAQTHSGDQITNIYNVLNEYMTLYWEVRNFEESRYQPPLASILSNKIKYLPKGQELFNLIKDKTTDNDDAIKLIIQYYEGYLKELLGDEILVNMLMKLYSIAEDFTTQDVKDFLSQNLDEVKKEYIRENPQYKKEEEDESDENEQIINGILDRYSKGEITKQQMENMLKEFAGNKSRIIKANWYQKYKISRKNYF
jgi:hypothetical protein